MIALAKFAAPVVVGQFALALAVTAPVILFSQLGLRSVQATDVRYDFLLGDYLALRLIMTAGALALIVGAVFTIAPRGNTAAVILLVALAKGIDSITDVIFGQWQRAERLDAVSIVLALNGVASLAGVCLALWATGSIVFGAAGFTVGSALAFGIAALADRSITLNAPLLPCWRRSSLWRLTKLAFPLGPIMLLVALNGNIPRYFVALHLGNSDLGIFAALSAVALAGRTFVGAFGQAISPRLAISYALGDRDGFVRSVKAFAVGAAVLGACGVLAALLAGRLILSMLYSTEYGDAAGVMAIAMAGAGLGYVASSLGYGMTATRHFSVQVPVLALVLMTLTVASAVLVPRYGISGAAWAGVISGVVQIAGSAFVIRTKLKLRALRVADE